MICKKCGRVLQENETFCSVCGEPVISLTEEPAGTVAGAVTEAEESYTSHNTTLLDVDGVVKKILATDYVKEALGQQ